MKNEPCVTIAEACRRTFLSDPQIRYRIERGELPAFKVGSRWLISEQALREKFGVGVSR